MFLESSGVMESTARDGHVGGCPMRAALRGHSPSGLAHVSCELLAGMAVLRGKVPTFYVKQLAQEIAKKVDGVDLVVNRVVVGPW